MRRSSRTKTDQASQDAPSKRLKATSKVAKSGKKKQPARGLETLSEIALSEAEQMKIALERSKTQQHSSHASGSGADEGTGVKLGVPDVPSYDSNYEQISWKSSDDEDDDDASKSKDDQDDTDDDDQDDADNDSEWTESDNDGDEFVHPKFTTHDKEDKEEDKFDLRVQTPSHYESTDDEAYDDVAQSGNAEEEEVVLERRDTEMTDASPTNLEATQATRNRYLMFVITALLSLCSLMLSIFEVNSISSSINLASITILLNPKYRYSLQHTSSSHPIFIFTSTTNTNPHTTTKCSNFLSSGPFSNFRPSLFSGFDTRLKTLEDNFSEFKQTNQYATALSLIPNIVNNYLGLKKLKDAVDVAVQLKSDKLREDAQTENQDFINNLDAHMQKIIKEQVKAQVKKQVSKILPKLEQSINDQLEAELLTQSSNEA
ncbi:hypothetical protein Tco_1273017 [Tanacetum coccineum]